jgi:ABC-type oligopeptide transport system ATPase subunit
VPLPLELIGRRDNDRRRSRLGDIICRLASTNEGEIIAHLENGGGGLSEATREKVRIEVEQAFNEGTAESKQHGTGAFRNTDGALEWSEVALFVQREKHRLAARHSEFIDDMASRTVYGREPTPKQHQYLHSLFYKLGGKITS